MRAQYSRMARYCASPSSPASPSAAPAEQQAAGNQGPVLAVPPALGQELVRAQGRQVAAVGVRCVQRALEGAQLRPRERPVAVGVGTRVQPRQLGGVDARGPADVSPWLVELPVTDRVSVAWRSPSGMACPSNIRC